MNRSESPSTALRAPSPPLGEKDGMRGYGSWKASFRFCARIGTVNRCASQRRGPDRGSATRSGQDNSVLHLQQSNCPGGDAIHGEPPFVFRMHWDHESPPHPSSRPPSPPVGGRDGGEGAGHGGPSVAFSPSIGAWTTFAPPSLAP